MLVDCCPGVHGNCLAPSEVSGVALNFSHLTLDLVNALQRRGSWLETVLLLVLRDPRLQFIRLNCVKDNFQFSHRGRTLGFIMPVGQTGTWSLIGKLKWFVPKWYNQGGLQSR